MRERDGARWDETNEIRGDLRFEINAGGPQRRRTGVEAWSLKGEGRTREGRVHSARFERTQGEPFFEHARDTILHTSQKAVLYERPYENIESMSKHTEILDRGKKWKRDERKSCAMAIERWWNEHASGVAR
jgi:hypothetical protein